MARPNRRGRAIYLSCAGVLLALLGVGTSFVSRHDGDIAASPPDPEARPLPLVVGSPEVSHVDRGLSRIANQLGHGQAEVRCWSTSEWQVLLRNLGSGDVNAYTTVDRRLVHLPWYTCSWLHVVAMRGLSRLDRAKALAPFAHELEHLRGVDGEAEAECYSYQHLAEVAEALAASRDESGRLAEVAWRELYPPSDPAYVSPECRNGGRLDLHPQRRSWP
ncbi:MAG TPA: hypothetical protein VE615_06410 [Gaiellaceae bacterium]|jgi:hypothetical protein|nr:hypothetical protein [Gaiellaceae bacterium]